MALWSPAFALAVLLVLLLLPKPPEPMRENILRNDLPELDLGRLARRPLDVEVGEDGCCCDWLFSLCAENELADTDAGETGLLPV